MTEEGKKLSQLYFWNNLTVRQRQGKIGWFSLNNKCPSWQLYLQKQEPLGVCFYEISGCPGCGESIKAAFLALGRTHKDNNYVFSKPPAFCEANKNFFGRLSQLFMIEF